MYAANAVGGTRAPGIKIAAVGRRSSAHRAVERSREKVRHVVADVRTAAKPAANRDELRHKRSGSLALPGHQ
jgi:hypothetical protein